MAEADEKQKKDGQITEKWHRHDTPRDQLALLPNIPGIIGHSPGSIRRMANVFKPTVNPDDPWHALIYATDHPYLAGFFRGNARQDLDSPDILKYATCAMITQGDLVGNLPMWLPRSIALRGSACATVLQPKTYGPNYKGTDGGDPDIELLVDPLTDEVLALSAQEAINLGADIVPIQVHLGSKPGLSNIQNFMRMKAQLRPFGIPMMWVVAVGSEMERTPQYFETAIGAACANGANIIKCYNFDGLRQSATMCTVPIVIAGGKSKAAYCDSHKETVMAVLHDAYSGIQAGAKGIDFGRNIFQDIFPQAMAAALHAIVFEGKDVEGAYAVYCEVKESMLEANHWNRDAVHGASWKDVRDDIVKSFINPPAEKKEAK